jgi:hypothetical protein
MGDLCDRSINVQLHKKRYMALIVTNGSRYRFSLQPHSYQRDFIIKFSDSLELNIYNFLYAGIHQDTLLTNPAHMVHDYYKSGMMLTYCISINTYREAVPETTGYLDPGPGPSRGRKTTDDT